MKKETAIKTITDCAKDYHAHLENQNLLFLFGTPEKPAFFESVFLPRHFLHLTGAEVSQGKFSGSSDFYEKALKNQLHPDDFSFAASGATEMKLSVLPQLMKIHRSAKMVGDYSFTKSVLYTEKLVGNVTASLGFVRDDEYYIPNTALKEDIRDITARPQSRMLAIFRKPVKQPHYEEACYTAKGIMLQDICLPQSLNGKLLLQLAGTQEKTSEPEADPAQPKKSMKERMTAAQDEADRRNESHAPGNPGEKGSMGRDRA